MRGRARLQYHDDVFYANPAIKNDLWDTLGGGQPARWHEVAMKLSTQAVFKGQITGSWLQQIEDNHLTGPDRAVAFLNAFCLLERGATVSAFIQGLKDAKLGLPAEKLEQAALSEAAPKTPIRDFDEAQFRKSSIMKPTATSAPVCNVTFLAAYLS